MYKAIKITKENLEYSATLTYSDIGKWAVIVSGCLELKKTKEEAEKLVEILNGE